MTRRPLTPPAAPGRAGCTPPGPPGRAREWQWTACPLGGRSLADRCCTLLSRAGPPRPASCILHTSCPPTTHPPPAVAAPLRSKDASNESWETAKDRATRRGQLLALALSDSSDWVQGSEGAARCRQRSSKGGGGGGSSGCVARCVYDVVVVVGDVAVIAVLSRWHMQMVAQTPRRRRSAFSGRTTRWHQGRS